MCLSPYRVAACKFELQPLLLPLPKLRRTSAHACDAVPFSLRTVCFLGLLSCVSQSEQKCEIKRLEGWTLHGKQFLTSYQLLCKTNSFIISPRSGYFTPHIKSWIPASKESHGSSQQQQKCENLFSHIVVWFCLFVFLCGAGDEPHALQGGFTAVLQRLAPNRSSQVSFEVLQYLWNFPYKLGSGALDCFMKPGSAYKVGLLVTSPASRPLRSHISLRHIFRFSTHRIVWVAP